MSPLEPSEEFLRRISVVARDWHSPWGIPRTANNLEVFAMNYVRLLGSTRRIHGELHPHASNVEMMQIDKAAAASDAVYGKIYADCVGFLNSMDEASRVTLDDLLPAWLGSSYARLEVGHRLAAALCLTDTPPELSVVAPWGAWSLVVPSGLLMVRGQPDELARVWCSGVEPEFCVTAAGRLVPFRTVRANSARAAEAIESLTRAACLILSDPQELGKSRRRSIDRGKRSGRSGPPDLLQARFVLGNPVSVDARLALQEYVDGGSGSALTVQFLVRGHARMQPHGPKSSLRKKIWIEPFWKGPEDTRVLLRSHQMGVSRC